MVMARMLNQRVYGFCDHHRVHFRDADEFTEHFITVDHNGDAEGAIMPSRRDNIYQPGKSSLAPEQGRTLSRGAMLRAIRHLNLDTSTGDATDTVEPTPTEKGIFSSAAIGLVMGKALRDRKNKETLTTFDEYAYGERTVSATGGWHYTGSTTITTNPTTWPPQPEAIHHHTWSTDCWWCEEPQAECVCEEPFLVCTNCKQSMKRL